MMRMKGVGDRARWGLLALLAGAGCGAAMAADAPAAATAAAATPAPLSIAAFGRVPEVQFVTLSPNGQLLAFDQAKGAERAVEVIEVANGQTRHTVALGTVNKLRGLAWADDETLLIDISIPHSYNCRPNVMCEAEWFRTMSSRLDGTPPRMLLNDDGDQKLVSAAYVLALRTDRPGFITMTTLDYSDARQRIESGTNLAQKDRDMTGWMWAAFDVDARSGKERLLATGTQYTDDWVVDAAGAPVARSEWRPDRNEYTVLVRRGQGWQEIFKLQDGSTLNLAGLDLEGKAIVALGANGTERSQAWAIPLDGSPVRSLHAVPGFDVDVAIVDPNRNAVVGVRGAAGVERHWFDPKLGAQQRSLEKAFPGMDVRVLDRSVVGRRVLVEVSSASQPPVYHLVDFDKGRADIVAEAYPGLAGAQLGAVRRFSYLARDGVSIPAFLTLPPGRPEKDLPVVILPHGGPESRDTGEFDWLAQFLASRGYAVLQPQFRGSLGYGDAFRRAGYRQWGGLMQDDVSDGVRHLVATGVADPSRVCIVGASYGGYAALAGSAFTPDLYTCAVSINGISDLPMWLGSKRKSYGIDSDSVDYWTDHIGPATDPNTIARSPSRAAASVRAPVLLLHGVDDTVVPLQQSKTMQRALTEAGKPVTLVTLPGEDHWLSRSTTRMRVLEELEKFLALHLH